MEPSTPVFEFPIVTAAPGRLFQSGSVTGDEISAVIKASRKQSGCRKHGLSGRAEDLGRSAEILRVRSARFQMYGI
jgi:hypothetical protein